jgi:hypothetical protein
MAFSVVVSIRRCTATAAAGLRGREQEHETRGKDRVPAVLGFSHRAGLPIMRDEDIHARP